MTKDYMWKHFERKGYEVAHCMSGKYVVTPNHGRGFGKVFDSLTEAHRYYFGY